MATQARARKIKPTLAAIEAARKFLVRYFTPTRLIEAASLSKTTGRRVYLKLEMELPTASFKVRGAMWALSEKLKEMPVTEVVASSTGNHGAAVAHAAQKLGVKATIFLPENCNPVKRERIAGLGAAIVENGSADLAGAFDAASEYSRKTGAYFLNDATDAVLPAGPATIGCEILEQLPETQAVYVPMGDTALIRGVAAAIKQTKPAVKLIGVQAKTAPSYYLSWKSGVATTTETCDTIADGLSTRTPDAANVNAIRELVDDVVLVSDDEMLRAIEFLLTREHIVAEPAGAAATAALLRQKSSAGGVAVALVTGANVSKEVLQKAIALR
ncbi:MAG TPA: pyridoxal-phosphate dependent enzyme [Candidatus Dormibacteraeota bacterium]|jgi:threonine dehydratase|nr:pyridoxal-phosphate dependent enzyme [Candidatus Dormibacteraeota bacterium]